MRNHKWIVSVVLINIVFLLNGQSDSLYSFSRPAMGTIYYVSFYANKEVNAPLIAEKVFDRIQFLDHILSDYKENAEVYRLNVRQPLQWESVSKELGFVLKKSIQWSKITDQYFDPAMGSLTHLWRRARRRNEFPADSMQTIAKNYSGIQYIALRKKGKQYQFKFLKKGVKLDFGGIGKGYAVDEALKTLKMQGVNIGMISAGSSITVSKAPPSKKGWSVAADTIFFSDGARRYIENRSQSVSGDDQQYLEWEGKRYSHLLNPITGKPLTNGATCLVEGPNGLITDALGTAFSIMHFDEIRKVLRWRKSIRVLCKRDDIFFKANWH
ncbi:MAG: FAD:protein FMN transferase [Haliscomenobacter sp.]|nr:FAD:protein FMN transferase [Haliscomenobacter sp.]